MRRSETSAEIGKQLTRVPTNMCLAFEMPGDVYDGRAKCFDENAEIVGSLDVIIEFRIRTE